MYGTGTPGKHPATQLVTLPGKPIFPLLFEQLFRYVGRLHLRWWGDLLLRKGKDVQTGRIL